MNFTIFNIIGLLIGVMILIGGLYYLIKEKGDNESRKIYIVTSLAGFVIVAVIFLKIFIWFKYFYTYTVYLTYVIALLNVD